ncbi:hypothetical protein GBA52_010710 [Prunus armeniaca]|nr:hypothetical protein GBA52_010710 [Prunus armeniaca]
MHDDDEIVPAKNTTCHVEEVTIKHHIGDMVVVLLKTSKYNTNFNTSSNVAVSYLLHKQNSPFYNKISSRKCNVGEEHTNPTLSLRTLDNKVDNLGRELWEEIKGVESKVMENMTSIETNILDAVTKLGRAIRNEELALLYVTQGELLWLGVHNVGIIFSVSHIEVLAARLAQTLPLSLLLLLLFVGPIPVTIGELKALGNVDLSENRLNGSIPFEIDQATNTTKRHTVSNPKQKIKYQRPCHLFNSEVFSRVQFHGPQNALSDVILDPTSHAPLGL